MAVQHIQRDKTNVYQAQLTTILSRLLQVKYDLQNFVDAMGRMKGDGTDPINVPDLIGEYLRATMGFPTIALAVAGVREIESLNGKLNTDAQITSMSTAITQAADKFA